MSKTEVTKEKKSVDVGKSVAYIAICVALMAVCAWLTVPMPAPFVQFTMQTFAVFFTILLLGEKRATIAIAAYVLLGLAGVPVFSKFTATSALLGSTGGYIVGFLFIPLFSFLAGLLPINKKVAQIIGLSAGLVVCYAFGTAWFVVLYTVNNGGISFWQALTLCVIPYILPDALKMALAFFLAPKIKKAVKLD